MTRKEATEKLEERGAIVTKSVTSKTELLFIGNRPGSKFEKAEEYGIPVYKENVLMIVLGDAPFVESSCTVSKAPRDPRG